jgi:polyphosphate kinase
MTLMWQDNRQAWDLASDGSYTQRRPPSPEQEISTHKVLMDSYREIGRPTGEYQAASR